MAFSALHQAIPLASSAFAALPSPSVHRSVEAAVALAKCLADTLVPDVGL